VISEEDAAVIERINARFLLASIRRRPSMMVADW
jgi:hypothetical protein